MLKEKLSHGFLIAFEIFKSFIWQRKKIQTTLKIIKAFQKLFWVF